MGLRGAPESVLELTIKTTVAFLRGTAEDVKRRAQKTSGVQARPIGKVGCIQSYDVSGAGGGNVKGKGDAEGEGTSTSSGERDGPEDKDPAGGVD